VILPALGWYGRNDALDIFLRKMPLPCAPCSRPISILRAVHQEPPSLLSMKPHRWTASVDCASLRKQVLYASSASSHRGDTTAAPVQAHPQATPAARTTAAYGLIVHADPHHYRFHVCCALVQEVPERLYVKVRQSASLTWRHFSFRRQSVLARYWYLLCMPTRITVTFMSAALWCYKCQEEHMPRFGREHS